MHVIIDLLTGSLHFINVHLTDGKQRLSGNNKTYVCAHFNELLGTASLSAFHYIIPTSGKVVRLSKHCVRFSVHFVHADQQKMSWFQFQMKNMQKCH